MPKFYGPENGHPNVLAPAKELGVSSAGKTLAEDEVDEVCKGWRNIFCWGWITYEDIFGVSHETKYCWRVSSIGYKNGSLSEFVFAFYTRNNCSDEECLTELASRPNPPEGIPQSGWWHDWLFMQAPTTYQRAPDWTPVDEEGRDRLGIKELPKPY